MRELRVCGVVMWLMWHEKSVAKQPRIAQKELVRGPLERSTGGGVPVVHD